MVIILVEMHEKVDISISTAPEAGHSSPLLNMTDMTKPEDKILITSLR